MARPFNLPPGVTLQDLEPQTQPSLEDGWNKLDRAYEEHVDHSLAPGQDWSPIPPVSPCTFPARPVNGGSLTHALPKSGQWCYEPKYNGWRTLVHAPTATMFNRYGEPLTIQRRFLDALNLLRDVRIKSDSSVEWFDCEALERRHGIGRGTLLVFDYVLPGCRDTYEERKARLIQVLPVHSHAAQPNDDQVYGVPAVANTPEAALELYHGLRALNRQWRCPFYEGLVAKRADSIYPVQLRSPALEFPGWVKHRWSR